MIFEFLNLKGYTKANALKGKCPEFPTKLQAELTSLFG